MRRHDVCCVERMQKRSAPAKQPTAHPKTGTQASPKVPGEESSKAKSTQRDARSGEDKDGNEEQLAPAARPSSKVAAKSKP